MKKNNKSTITENEIIYSYLSKLHFNKKESFNFKNDGAIIRNKLKKEIVVTNDTIVQDIDFFKNDNASSVAQKIFTYNLSDLSSMGAEPYSYTMSLSIPKGIKVNWIKEFTKKLLSLQKKYKVFLLGGDVCMSDNIYVSANFFGYINKNSIIKREFPKLGDSIWVTGNIGESYIGLLIKKNNIDVKEDDKKYFINKYLYPVPCMLGHKIYLFSKIAIDISDGFYGDLSKLLNNNLGASVSSSKIPFSNKAKALIDKNVLTSDSLLRAGDDYQLIFTNPLKFDSKIKAIAKKNKIKISKVGNIIDKKGIFVDNKKLENSNNSYLYSF